MHTHSLPTPPPLPSGPAAGQTGFAPSLEPADRFDPLAPPAFDLAPARAAPPPASKTPGRFGGGTVLWGAAAAAAVAYLSIVLFRPDLIARVDQSGPAVAEIEALRGELDTLRRDMAEIRSSLTQTASEQKVLFDKVAELNPAATVPAAQTGPDAPALRIDGAPMGGALAPRAEAAAQGATAKVAEAKVLNAKPGMETGSVKPVPPPAVPASAAKTAAAAAEPPPSEPPVVTPSAKPVGVQIASGSSLDSLRLSWNLLSETHADKLKSLEPRYSLSVDNGAIVYNLLAGPVKTEADAKKMCKALTAKAVPCKVVGEFGGASL